MSTRFSDESASTRWVERGGVKRALDQSKYDASSLLGQVAFYALLLFVLQLAFGVFGPNPVSDLLYAAIGYLPNVFVAIVILVVASAIAAGVKDIVQGALGGLTYGRALALTASTAIIVLGVFAALNQLRIAPTIVNALFIGLVAMVVGIGVVAIGGGGIRTVHEYWQRAARRTEEETSRYRTDRRTEPRGRQIRVDEDEAPATETRLGGRTSRT